METAKEETRLSLVKVGLPNQLCREMGGQGNIFYHHVS